MYKGMGTENIREPRSPLHGEEHKQIVNIPGRIKIWSGIAEL